MSRLSIIILTYNEELNLPKSLSSLKRLNGALYVVDSYSTDRTENICREYGADFYQNRFETHTKQWQWALENLPISDDTWVLGLDADQELLPELADEINALMDAQSDIDGYYLKRRNYFLGTWIRYGGYYPRYLLKLFRKNAVYLDPGELMDHHFYVNGKTARLKHDFIENNLKEDLDFWTEKHNRYASLQASEEFGAGISQAGDFFGNQDQKRVYLKNRWNKMPLFIRPFFYFMYRYVFLGGFLDGRTGMIFHYLQAFWYRFLVDSKIYELKSRRNHE
jgi:glycosyltransferase involved in cell wall biosynthesis